MQQVNRRERYQDLTENEPFKLPHARWIMNLYEQTTAKKNILTAKFKKAGTIQLKPL